MDVCFQSYKVKLAIGHLEFFSVISFSWVIWKSSSNLWHLAEYLFLFGLSWLVEEMGIFDYKRLESSSNPQRILRQTPLPMEGSPRLGPKGLIKKHEFVRILIQCLYSIGYEKSASCLELESGISCKSDDFQLLESQISSGNWDGCVDTLNAIKDLRDDTRAAALFLVFKQCLLEYLSCGDDKLALAILQKEVSALQVDRDKVHNLAWSILSWKEVEQSKIDDNAVRELRKKLLQELEKWLPSPITLPERRLEHLVETAVLSQIDSCMYHNLSDEVSLYADHSCSRDQIPTETVQVRFPATMLLS